jgi:hypothetical protein
LITYTIKTKRAKPVKKALGNGRLSSKGLCEEEASLEDAKVFIFRLYIFKPTVSIPIYRG